MGRLINWIKRAWNKADAFVRRITTYEKKEAPRPAPEIKQLVQPIAAPQAPLPPRPPLAPKPEPGAWILIKKFVVGQQVWGLEKNYKSEQFLEDLEAKVERKETEEPSPEMGNLSNQLMKGATAKGIPAEIRQLMRDVAKKLRAKSIADRMKYEKENGWEIMVVVRFEYTTKKSHKEEYGKNGDWVVFPGDDAWAGLWPRVRETAEYQEETYEEVYVFVEEIYARVSA